MEISHRSLSFVGFLSSSLNFWKAFNIALLFCGKILPFPFVVEAKFHVYSSFEGNLLKSLQFRDAILSVPFIQTAVLCRRFHLVGKSCPHLLPRGSISSASVTLWWNGNTYICLFGVFNHFILSCGVNYFLFFNGSISSWLLYFLEVF